MTDPPPPSGGGLQNFREGEAPDAAETEEYSDLLPVRSPTKVQSEHLAEIPGTEQGEVVDWVRLPHWRLVRQLQSGNEDALSWIIGTYRAPLLRYARRLLGGTADPEDVVQEAFFRLWARRGSLRPSGSIRAFLFISVRTIARDEYRRWGRRRKGSAHGPGENIPAPVDPSEDLHGSELLNALQDAVQSLSPRRREVFILIRREGLTLEEAAQRLNLTTRTVKNTMTSALAELRKKLGPFLR